VSHGQRRQPDGFDRLHCRELWHIPRGPPGQRRVIGSFAMAVSSSTEARRQLTMSRSGRWVAVCRPDVIELVDLLGTLPNRAVSPATGHARFVGRELWVLDGDLLHRVAPDDLRLLHAPTPLPGHPADLLPSYGATATDAIARGVPPCWLSVRGNDVVVEPLHQIGKEEQVLASQGSRVIAACEGTLRAIDRGRGEVWRSSVLQKDVRAGAILFGGRAIAILRSRVDGDLFLVLTATGSLIHQIAVPHAQGWAVAEEIGHGFVAVDGALARIDLRYGKVRGRVAIDTAIEDLAVDQDARHLVLADTGGQIRHYIVSELFAESATAAEDGGDADGDEPEATGTGDEGHPRGSNATSDAEPIGRSIQTQDTGDEAHASGSNGTSRVKWIGSTIQTTIAPPAADAAEGDSPVELAPTTVQGVGVPANLPLAFGPPPAQTVVKDDGASSPYPSARAHLDALLDVVATRTALAIADAWNSGRLSPRDATGRPHEAEVGALIGGIGNFARDQLQTLKDQLDARQREAAPRAQASMARGTRLPFPELATSLGLSALASQILLIVAAPALRGEIARLYGVLTNDPSRAIVDRFLVETIVARDQSTLRDQIAGELAPDAPLVRHGAVHVGTSTSISLFAPLSVPDAVLDRLRGAPPARVDGVSTVRGLERRVFEKLFIPDTIKRDLVTAVAEPRPPRDPLRLVLRGRLGSGRRTAVAALAARVGREIVAIDTTRMSRSPRELVEALRSALIRAALHGLVPVLSGLEEIDPTDTDLSEKVRQVLRVHPGPIVVRTSPEGNLPLDPGFVSIQLPPLTETDRADAWRAAIADNKLTADADALAGRYRIGPGVIVRVAETAASRQLVGLGEDATSLLDDQVRQHVATRLDHVAKCIERLASFEDVALPEDMLDSLREFIGRVRYRRTIYERWHYDTKITTARGLTALFYGPPGTGKSMVAGVIARELGLEMYRVDLARVVSKWVGETEKNLAQVFDAAEDGQVLILFDEADSLFAKRTDVRTSNDRYANLEVNYLLQRLDTFEGIAILTSNLDSAIDPAFRRRLTMRLQFPFPDEETRVRLWQAHVTSQTPQLGDINFVELANRFPLSGGYIRNCALRAAFLAAHENRPLGQEHLLRAIQLEYRELGKLSTSSRME